MKPVLTFPAWSPAELLRSRVAWAVGVLWLVALTATGEGRTLTLGGVTVSNQSSPTVPVITAGYLVRVGFEARWGQDGWLERAGLEIVSGERILLQDTLEFRDAGGRLVDKFMRDVTLPPDLPAGRHVLTVRCLPVAQMRGGTPVGFQTVPATVAFAVAAGPVKSVAATPAPPPRTPSLAEILALYRDRAQRAHAAIVRELAGVMGAPPPSLAGSGPHAPLVTTIEGGTRLLRSVRVEVVDLGVHTPEVEALMARQVGAPPAQSVQLTAAWEQRRRRPAQAVLHYHESVEGETSAAPPPYVRTLGPLHVEAVGRWHRGKALGSFYDLRATAALGPFHEVKLHANVHQLPATEEQAIRARFYPLPAGTTPARSREISDGFDAALKAARQEAGRRLLEAFVQIMAAYGPLLLDEPVNDAARAGITSAGEVAVTIPPPPSPAGQASPPPPATGTAQVPLGVRGGGRVAAPPVAPTIWAGRVAEWGEASAARAAAVVAETIPSAEGLSPLETAALAEAALTDRDPAEVMAALAEEEQAGLTSGRRDGLRLRRVTATPERPEPGASVTVTLTVENTARDGGPAIYDVGLCDYHDNNRDVARLRRRALAPGATARHTLTFAAPRAYNFGGYAYIEPMAFAGDTLPQEVLNLRIAWDGSTMTDEEIIAELHDRNPCPDDYPLTGDRLTRWVAFYRAQGHATFAALQNEAIAAQRERMQADLEARLNDPARLDQLQADLDGAANTKLLAAYESLRRLAREWGRIHGLDLVAMVDDAVYVDAQSRVVGDVAAARAQVLAAVEAKQRGGAVQSLLLGTGSGQTSALHRRVDPLVNQALLAANVGNIENVATKNLVDFWMKRAVEAHRQLQRVARDAHTSVRAWEASRNNLREVIAEANRQLGGVNHDFFKTTLAKAGEQLRELDRVAAQAEVFRREGRRALGTKKWAERFGKAVEKVGDLWALYDTGEKVAARVSAGEDFAVALGKETGAWAVKKVITACPVIGAADAVMGGTAALLKYLGPEYWEQEGVDPAQYTASGVLDIGLGVSFAAVEDLGTKTAERLEKLPPLEPAERARLERQIEAFEARLEATTDPEVRQRMLTVRAYARQTLRERS